jgi:cation diffusion facilitator CzcD-associated flavoprotein CzcO
VHLVNLRAEPIECITPQGVKTTKDEYEIDLLVFALGFHAFTGALDRAGIRNHLGHSPTDSWERGPRTAFGLMTPGFPNLFMPTGPGSPSVLANLVIQNEFHIDWIAELIEYMDVRGYAWIEPGEELVNLWTRHVAEACGRGFGYPVAPPSPELHGPCE